MTIDVFNNVDAKPYAHCAGNERSGANIQLRNVMHQWATAADVTTITLSSDVANAFAIGSSLEVWSY